MIDKFINDGLIEFANGWYATIMESETSEDYILEISDADSEAGICEFFRSDNPHFDAAKMIRDYMSKRAEGMTAAAEDAEQLVTMMEDR